MLPSGVGLATRGKALRLRFGDDVAFREVGPAAACAGLEVSPLEPDADFTVTAEATGPGCLPAGARASWLRAWARC